MSNPTAMLAYHARTRPEGEALVFEGRRISYRELHARALAAAVWLRQEGVGPGTIVALLMKNSPAFLELVFAASHLGAVVLPLNFRLAADEIAYITGHAGAALLIVDESLASRVAGLAIRRKELSEAARRDIRSLAATDVAPPPAHPAGPETVVRLMYTSGTTDRPKGVTHTCANIAAKNLDHVIALGLTSAERLLVVGPLYHVGAFDLPGIAVLLVGGTIVLLEDFDPVRVLETIAAERITGAWLPPVMTNAILALPDARRFDVATLRWCIAGGERTPEARIRAFVATFPCARFIDAYGMTETCAGDTFMEAGREIEKIGSTGRATMQLGLEIRDDQGRAVARGVEGEICMKGPKVTAGYWNDDALTAAAFWPDGWLRSGDVGYLDAEGFLFLTDRKKDMIISGGENVASSEVERVLYEHPAILEAAVVARPDAMWGEVPVAIVVLRPGQRMDLPTLQDHCRGRLAGFKVPKDLVLVDALPRNPSGKVLKRELRARLGS